MDWSACIICQQKTGECLRCPLNSAVGSLEKRAEAYEIFLQNVSRLRALNCLPRPILFDEGTTADDFTQNQAKWHKTCHNYFGKDRVDRAERKKKMLKMLVHLQMYVPNRLGKHYQKQRVYFVLRLRVICMKSVLLEKMEVFAKWQQTSRILSYCLD